MVTFDLLPGMTYSKQRCSGQGLVTHRLGVGNELVSANLG